MERSALYRRALAPVMTCVGIVGIFGGMIGALLRIQSPTAFVSYWFGIAAVALVGTFLLIRRQAWQSSEPFWSPPTRRVVQALLPALSVGFIFGVAVLVLDNLPDNVDPPTGGFDPIWPVLIGLPALWSMLYGCAIHAAGFFMPRGIKLFGWAILILGCAAMCLLNPKTNTGLIATGHIFMGIVFGVLHLAYGTYLSLTEKGKNAA